MYTMLNNLTSSKFDLYLPGRLVASLHYKIEDDDTEIMFVYCEAVEEMNSDIHCRELIRQAVEGVRNRRLEISVVCPIALKYLNENVS